MGFAKTANDLMHKITEEKAFHIMFILSKVQLVNKPIPC